MPKTLLLAIIVEVGEVRHFRWEKPFVDCVVTYSAPGESPSCSPSTPAASHLNYPHFSQGRTRPSVPAPSLSSSTRQQRNGALCFCGRTVCANGELTLERCGGNHVIRSVSTSLQSQSSYFYTYNGGGPARESLHKKDFCVYLT